MSVEINRFRSVFFEESIEGLAVMESGLLALAETVRAEGVPSSELINEVFCAAHSIKGGSGMFGYTDLAELTHLLETLLDQMRSGKRAMTMEISRLLLDAVDQLRAMLDAGRRGEAIDAEALEQISERLRVVLEQKAAGEAAAAAAGPAKADAGGAPAVWRISFRPELHLFRTGNDPLRLIKELRALGEATVEADVRRIPSLDALEPEDCFLAFEIELETPATREQIAEVFAWVEGDAVVEIDAVKAVEADAVAGEAARAEVAPRGPAAVATGPKEASRGAAPAGSGGEGTSIRVSTEKVDAIINLVGELVITQSMLNIFGQHFEMSMLDKLRDGLGLLERNTRELQETVLKIRMLPISYSFNRFPRLVHDLSAKLDKKIVLKITGEHTELDKTVLEKISDPLVHLVRNSLDHGIERPEVRRAAGKPETGTVHLHAAHEGGAICVDVSDDGAGLNTERILAKARAMGLVGADEVPPDEKIHELLFVPGFSTAEQVTDLSGRGVGMDVVMRNIRELGGRIDIYTRPGKGTKFHIRLPLTLAILDGQLVSVAEQTYVIPLVSIVESIQVKKQHVYRVAGGGEVYRLREDYIPIIRLYETFRLEPLITDLTSGLLVVIEADGRKAGIFVDDLLAQQQVVIKSLESNFRKVEGVSGATILGDGTVALILDIPGVIGMALSKPAHAA